MFEFLYVFILAHLLFGFILCILNRNKITIHINTVLDRDLAFLKDKYPNFSISDDAKISLFKVRYYTECIKSAILWPDRLVSNFTYKDLV